MLSTLRRIANQETQELIARLQAAETFQDALKVKRFSPPAEFLLCSPHYRVLCPAVTHPCGAAGYITVKQSESISKYL